MRKKRRFYIHALAHVLLDGTALSFDTTEGSATKRRQIKTSIGFAFASMGCLKMERTKKVRVYVLVSVVWIILLASGGAIRSRLLRLVGNRRPRLCRQ
jgi:ABC-type Mn2+/Zn2+ transport system permease subunit